MKILYVIIFQLFFFIMLTAQFYGGSKYTGIGLPFFEVEVFRTIADNPNQLRLYIFSEILYDDLTFVKSDTLGYLAEYECIAAVYDPDEIQVASKVIKKTIREQFYESTNSRDKKISLNYTFDLDPAKYVIKIKSNDLISGKSANRKFDLDLLSFSKGKFFMSDLLLLEKFNADSVGMTKRYLPAIRSNFPRKAGDFYIYFDLIIAAVPQTIDIRYQFVDEKDKVELDSIVTTVIQDSVSNHILKLDRNLLKKNKYSCEVSIIYDKKKYVRTKKFSFFWIDLPGSKADISLALQQMRYILHPDSLDKYEDADLLDQQRFFERFWAERDNDPETAVVEIMEEYFRRVNFANREYSTSFRQDGWLTDRGRILIKFGFPDEIERHPFEVDTMPYEFWRYYNLRKEFLFYDRTGMGDYRLDHRYYDEEYN
jgi:GWxTD domain-containing protein